jgi:hypothetical protein
MRLEILQVPDCPNVAVLQRRLEHCDYLNFFTDRPSAQAWAELNPQVTGGILDLSEATRLGQTIFGGLLNS